MTAVQPYVKRRKATILNVKPTKRVNARCGLVVFLTRKKKGYPLDLCGAGVAQNVRKRKKRAFRGKGRHTDSSTHTHSLNTYVPATIVIESLSLRCIFFLSVAVTIFNSSIVCGQQTSCSSKPYIVNWDALRQQPTAQKEIEIDHERKETVFLCHPITISFLLFLFWSTQP